MHPCLFKKGWALVVQHYYAYEILNCYSQLVQFCSDRVIGNINETNKAKYNWIFNCAYYINKHLVTDDTSHAIKLTFWYFGENK